MNVDAPFLNNVFKWPQATKTGFKVTTDGIKIRTWNINLNYDLKHKLKL